MVFHGRNKIISSGKSIRGQRAFTLAEILVVIAVLGLLATIIFTITRGAGEQGQIAKGLYFSQHLQNSLGSYVVGAWNFDEGSGTAVNDTSGWGNNGSLVNSPVWRCASTDTSYTPSGQGCSLEFNGSTNYVGNIASTDSLEPSSITVSSWINMDVNAPTGRNIWLTKWYGYSLEIQADTRIPYFRLYGPGDIYSNKALTLGRWHHFVGTYDPSTGGRVYLDGELAGSIGPSGDITHSRNYPLNIGRYAGGVYFDGLIDEVRIYSVSLSLSQVRSQYYAGLGKLFAGGLIDGQEYERRLATR
jgi:prepilin-type N-terminal cleavage/methylation domain-containing protein